MPRISVLTGLAFASVTGGDVPNQGMNAKTLQRDDWKTPFPFFNRLHAEFRFTLDAAASDSNNRLPRYWTEHDDALKQDWKGERIFCNPPFSLKTEFARKASECRADVAVLIFPAFTDQPWFHDHVLDQAAEVRFIRGRLLYEPADGVKATSPRFPSIVAIYHSCLPRVTVASSITRA